MPVTPNFALPYPGPSDAPCDFAEQWCELSDAFQGVLDTFTAITQRTVPAIPAAQLTLSTPVTITDLNPIPFDGVSLDTAGWIDFDASRSTMTIDRAGIYVVNGRGETVPTLNVVTTFTMAVVNSATGATVVDDSTQHNIAGQQQGLAGSVLLAVTTPTTLYLTMSSSVPDTLITVQKAALTVFWHADRAAP